MVPGPQKMPACSQRRARLRANLRFYSNAEQACLSRVAPTAAIMVAFLLFATAAMTEFEGYIPFHGHRTWYRVVGECAPGRLPVVLLHGGPGVPSDYIEPMETLSQAGRQVIRYDQLGCGRSDHVHDPSLWTIALFVEELATLRRELALERIHLLGQSWGGMLAMESLLAAAQGVNGLILADSLSSTTQWISEANRLRRELPPEVQKTLARHEEAGTTESPEYEQAMMVFYRRHLCRLDPWPDGLLRSFEQLQRNPEVYFTLWGPSEFHATGKLKEWDIRARLGEIGRPTLILSGRYDEATPLISQTLRDGIPGAEWELFEESAHMPHLEEPEKFRATVNRFLDRAESPS